MVCKVNPDKLNSGLITLLFHFPYSEPIHRQLWAATENSSHTQFKHMGPGCCSHQLWLDHLWVNSWGVSHNIQSFSWYIVSKRHRYRPVVFNYVPMFVFFQQELVYFTFSRRASSNHTVVLELMLQRCNEIQLWVMTEVLLCSTLCKRVQLIKKFIKIAAQLVFGDLAIVFL